MASMATILSFLFLFLTSVLANTEKAIFLGPEPVSLPLTHPTLSDLRLHTLTPANGTLRTSLAAQFPSPDHPRGTATWLILDNLTPHQRYEVRVCWAATQPTAFWVDTFPFSTVRDSPELLASLQAYSASLQEQKQKQKQKQPDASRGSSISSSSNDQREEASSILLLRIFAAADYFTTDAALMRNVPGVDVDIILDPFLFNALPRSIAGTACYIVAVGVASFFLAGKVVSWIRGVIASGSARAGLESVKKRQ